MKHASKMTITLSMIYIGAMAVASTPEWIRAARDFVGQSTGHSPTSPKSTVVAGSAGRNS